MRAAAVDVTWRHLPALDGMRALAVIAVLLFHGGYLQGGFLGVDLFFALSGYLITSLLIRDAEGSGVRLATFWGRRFRRLLPAVFSMIAIVAVWAFAFGSAADLDGVKRDGPWAVVYMANWHFISESQGYWASFAQPSMFDHLWSLAIEEQFYVIWPIAVLAIWKFSARPQRFLMIGSAVGAMVSVAVMLWLYDGGDPTRVYMGTDTRAASLLVGAFAATSSARRWARQVTRAVGERVDWLIAALGVLMLVAWLTVDGASAEALYRGGLLVHSTICAVLIALIGATSSGRAVGTLSWRPLVWIGTLSYGLYLWHWPVYVVLTPSRVGFDGVGLLAVRIAVSLAFAIVSFRVIEDPLRHRASWLHGASGVVALVVSVASLLTLLAVLPDPPVEVAAFDPGTVSGVEVRAAERSAERPVATVPATTMPPRSEVDLGVAIDAAIGATTSTSVPVRTERIESVLWAGDSVAFDTAGGLGPALAGAGLTVDVGAAYPGVHLGGDGDDRQATQLVRHLERSGADTVLLMASSWDVDLSSDRYRDALAEIADIVDGYGARLVLVSAPPVADDDINDELIRLASVSREFADADPRVWFIGADDAWAFPVVADENGDGAPERKRDLVHVCPAGAAEFGAWLVTELDRLFLGLVPADPAEWAGGAWVTDPRYDDPVGACAPV